jgi:hypothetical protein
MDTISVCYTPCNLEADVREVGALAKRFLLMFGLTSLVSCERSVDDAG